MVATDIDRGALEKLEARGTAELRAVVSARQVGSEEPGLEAGAYDVILLSEVDHLLAERVRYLGKLRGALAPRGRIVVTNRRTHHDALVEAVKAAGFTRMHEVEALADHYILIVEGS